MESKNNVTLSGHFIWDAHCGFEMVPSAPIGPLLAPWQTANVNYFSINVYYDPLPWTRCIENIATLRRRIPIEAAWCQIVSTVAEIKIANANGKAAVTFDIEGMNALNERIDLVQSYYELGVRQMLFAYNKNNPAGSGCHDTDTGLTPFGRAVIDEMNRVGMLIDCSHASFKTSMEAMARSQAPVIFSHANAKGLADHGRNINDEQIRACAATGGVVGINGLSLFLGSETQPLAESVAQHIAYIANLVGHEHVGLGLDYDPEIDYGAGEDELFATDSTAFWPPEAGYGRPIEFLDIKDLPAICAHLDKIGFTQQEIKDILGNNFRRVAQQVWN